MIQWLEQPLIYWHSGGLLLIPIGLVSLGIWTYFLRTRSSLLHTMRSSEKIEPLIRQLDKHASPSDIDNAMIGVSGIIALIIRITMHDILKGAKLMESFENRENEGILLFQKDMIILSALTAIAPLLGLLGTVMGMIETFNAVSAISGETSIKVASGISRALITTQFGLVVALPGVFGMANLRKLLSHVEVRMKECRLHIIAFMEQQKGNKIL